MALPYKLFGSNSNALHHLLHYFLPNNIKGASIQLQTTHLQHLYGARFSVTDNYDIETKTKPQR